jgi:bilirubin oxidase
MAGLYILTDPVAEAGLNIPSGAFDIPLVLSCKQYNSDGSLFSPKGETQNLFGDVVDVNGQPWPFLKVEPRAYRFRLLDASISRTFFLYLERDAAQGKKIPFYVIASDAGLLRRPQLTEDLYISMAERWEIVVDFSGFAGQKINLRNSRDFTPDDEYPHTDKVMQFQVANAAAVKSTLVTDKDWRVIPAPTRKVVDKKFRFERKGGQWTINGVTFSDRNNRVLSKPARGSVEVWELENTSGGWSHPVHVHLVDFRVVKRTGGKRNKVYPYEEAALKDVVWLGPGETVTVEAIYGPWDGLYMFHCHNLIHEDSDMMAAFNVTALTDLGYKETSEFRDPMDPRFQFKAITAEASTPAAIKTRIEDLAKLQPYSEFDKVQSALTSYWASKGGKVRRRRSRREATRRND